MLKKNIVRLFVQVTVLIFFIYPAILEAEAKKRDDFEIIVRNRRDFLTGGAKPDKKDPDIANRIAQISSLAKTHWESMDKRLWRSYLWKDIPFSDAPEKIVENFDRLRSIALGYSIKGSRLSKNKKVRNDIVFALDWLYQKKYAENFKHESSKRLIELEIPIILNDILILLHKDLSGEQLAKYGKWVFSLNGNLTDENQSPVNALLNAYINILGGAIVRDPSKIDSAIIVVNRNLQFVENGSGFYEDGSFLSNGKHPYSAGVAVDYFSVVSDILFVLRDSEQKKLFEEGSILKKWMIKTFNPIFNKGKIMDMVRGVEVAIPGRGNERVEQLVQSGLKLLEIFKTDEEVKAIVYQWVRDYEVKKLFKHLTLGSISYLKEIESQKDFIAKEDSIKIEVYWNMDRVVAVRKNYAFGIAMFSKRTYNYESVNGLNSKGWYTAYGTTYLSIPSFNSSMMWPAIDPYKLPGSTVAKIQRKNSELQSHTSKANFAGGAKIGERFGAIGLELEDVATSLKAKKSWFIFDEEIVALGTGITCHEKVEAETILENHNIDLSNSQVVINGESISPDFKNKVYTGTEWMFLKPFSQNTGIGYYFPKYYNLNLSIENRIVNWGEVNQHLEDSSSGTANFFVASFNHGLKPSAGHYQYCILPGINQEEMQEYDQNPDIIVLENNNFVHAVKENTLNLIAANFWTNKKAILSVNGSFIISSDQPISFLYRENETEAEIVVCDPTQENTSILNLEILNSNIKELLNSYPGVTISGDEESVKITIDLSLSKGNSLSYKFRLKENQEKQ